MSYPGLRVQQTAAVIMATEANKNLIKDAGLLTGEAASATLNDLVIIIKARDGSADGALDEAVYPLQLCRQSSRR